jgi:hypothetical protein
VATPHSLLFFLISHSPFIVVLVPLLPFLRGENPILFAPTPPVDGLEEAEAVFDGHLFDSQHVLTGSFLSFFFVFFFLGSWLDVFSGVVGSTTGFDSLMIGRH